MRGSNPIAFNLRTDEQPTPGMAAQDLYGDMLKKVLESVQANLDKLASEAKRTNDRHEETMKILRDNFSPTTTRRRGRTENANPSRQEPTRGRSDKRRKPRNKGGDEERNEGRNNINQRENENKSDEECPENQENGKDKSDEQTPRETPRNEQNQDDARSGLNSKREERREKEKEDAPPESK
ncbi:conglutin beta 1-like [Mercurialis annua]|uniref:conglutin beta 1-like n=1 Tax=Mercurialis annua TaxID=3986 RepID=UPI0021602DDC|nr:conglutin beta 1-like [Mercurialis annua]